MDVCVSRFFCRILIVLMIIIYLVLSLLLLYFVLLLVYCVSCVYIYIYIVFFSGSLREASCSEASNARQTACGISRTVPLVANSLRVQVQNIRAVFL